MLTIDICLPLYHTLFFKLIENLAIYILSGSCHDNFYLLQ